MANKTQQQPQFSEELVSIDFLRRRVDRPEPWINARLDELETVAVFSLDGVKYYRATVIAELQKISGEWSERIRQAKRQAVAAGE